MVLALIMGVGSPAFAQPDPTTPPDEGGTDEVTTLRSNLESAAAGWLEAEAALQAAKTKQVELEKVLQDAELDLARARVGVARYAGEAYKTGRVGVLGTILSATSPDEFIGRAVAIDRMTQRDQVLMSDLADAKHRAEEAKKGIEQTIQEQSTASQDMRKRQLAAERALAGMGWKAVSGWLDPDSPAARPAPRNANGGWERESCLVNDPTTGGNGCITPRTLHALNEAQDAGFGRFVSCYRANPPRYEHPKGRACDFSANKSGFVDSSAGGDDRSYGDRLASFFVKNASSLGVMYVVWYCKIWITGGWKFYSSTGSSCGDNPAGDHTNHVHLSIY